MTRKIATLDGEGMTHAEKVTCINAAWRTIAEYLGKLSDQAPCNAFYEATERAREGEKRHRALGRSIAANQRYRANVETAARMMVVRAFVTHEPGTLFSGPDIVHTRADILLAKACRACLTPEQALWLSSALVARTGKLDLSNLDYCEIVAPAQVVTRGRK